MTIAPIQSGIRWNIQAACSSSCFPLLLGPRCLYQMALADLVWSASSSPRFRESPRRVSTALRGGDGRHGVKVNRSKSQQQQQCSLLTFVFMIFVQLNGVIGCAVSFRYAAAVSSQSPSLHNSCLFSVCLWIALNRWWRSYEFNFVCSLLHWVFFCTILL